MRAAADDDEDGQENYVYFDVYDDEEDNNNKNNPSLGGDPAVLSGESADDASLQTMRDLMHKPAVRFIGMPVASEGSGNDPAADADVIELQIEAGHTLLGGFNHLAGEAKTPMQCDSPSGECPSTFVDDLDQFNLCLGDVVLSGGEEADEASGHKFIVADSRSTALIRGDVELGGDADSDDNEILAEQQADWQKLQQQYQTDLNEFDDLFMEHFNDDVDDDDHEEGIGVDVDVDDDDEAESDLDFLMEGRPAKRPHVGKVRPSAVNGGKRGRTLGKAGPVPSSTFLGKQRRRHQKHITDDENDDDDEEEEVEVRRDSDDDVGLPHMIYDESSDDGGDEEDEADNEFQLLQQDYAVDIAGHSLSPAGAFLLDGGDEAPLVTATATTTATTSFVSASSFNVVGEADINSNSSGAHSGCSASGTRRNASGNATTTATTNPTKKSVVINRNSHSSIVNIFQ